MPERIFFQCSLPRAGSTLLQNVLAQNPDFYATPTSGIVEIFLNARNIYTNNIEFKAQDVNVVEPAFKALCKGGMDAYFNAITDNKVNEFKKQVGIDDLFHLFMIATLDDGRLIRIEKNAEIDVKQISSIPNVNNDNMLNINIGITSNSLTVNELLTNTKNKIGDRLFWDYNSMKNNCGDFIYNILYTNGYDSSNPSMKSFIKQDLTKLSKSLSSTSKNIMNTITNLGKRTQILVKGAGL